MKESPQSLPDVP